MRNYKHTLLATALTAALFTGSPAIAKDRQDVVRNKGEGIIVNSFGNCVRTQWDAGGDICNPEAPPPAPAPAPRQLSKEERSVYFEFNRSTLMPSEQAKLDNLANVLKTDKTVQRAQIVGFADRIGTPSYNEQLSQRRAETVEQYLHARGYVNTARAETRWLGESVPATQCSDALPRPELIGCLQKDRRVEVELELIAPAPTR